MPYRLPAIALCTIFAFVPLAALKGEALSGVKFHGTPKDLNPSAVIGDWPCLLGPDHNEVSSETHLLHVFPASGPTVVWEVDKGEGYAAPAVAGGRLVLFHRQADQERIDCLEALTGKPLWSYAYPTEYTDDYGYTNGPRSSPVIHEGEVFAIGAEGKLHCLELATGKLLWRHDLTGEYKLKKGFFGVGSTPLAEGDRLVVNVGAPHGPCVAAFDAHTGKVAWTAGDSWGASYASPVPAVLHGQRRVLVFAGGKSSPPTGGLLCIDPSNGRVDFTFPWRGNRRESVNASSPVAIGNQVFISECYGAGGVLLEISKDFHATPAWTNPSFGTHFMSAVAREGCLYGVDGHGPDDAFLVAVDLKTGKELWRKQPEWNETVDSPDGPRQLATGAYRCWLMPADGHYLCLGEFGHLLWIDLTPKGYTELQRAWLFAAGETWTPPVLSRGLLYICQNARDSIHNTNPRLLCYDLRGP